MEATANTFKSFSEKSKAKRGLLAFVAKQFNVEVDADTLAALLHMSGEPMKWGYNVQEVTDKFTPATEGQTEEAQADTASESDAGEQEDDEVQAPVASGNMFGGIAATLGTVAATPAATASAPRAASRSSYTIEKDRPMQNGIKRPSAGGLCREVWDEMDSYREATGDLPTTNVVREAAAKHNWNSNNALIEYYQWRKFNGITGRAKKVAAATEAA